MQFFCKSRSQGEDAKGSYGVEDDYWCGIGEPIYDTNVRIKNKKNQECLITNLYSDDSVLLLDDCNHSVWTYKNEMLILKATGKCLFDTNSKNTRMTKYDKGDEQIYHHIHFKIVDNKYICIENNIDPKDRCSNGKIIEF